MKYPFKKVIVWGHPLHSNTFSYINFSFYKAFKHLGYETYWLDNTPENSTCMDFNDCLFITESQVDSNIPKVKSSRYVLHNCDRSKYSEVIDRVKALQVYTNDVIGRDERVDSYTYISKDGTCLYQPWATDLLPEEINIDSINQRRERTVYWVGTLGEGVFGNKREIDGFKKACEENGISFVQRHSVSDEDHRKLISSSYLAPQISGTWQVEKGLIPCRIFKNISYGQYGITNSEKVNEIFDGSLIFNLDTNALFYDSERLKSSQNLRNLMQIVKDKHTYLNRIDRILSVL